LVRLTSGDLLETACCRKLRFPDLIVPGCLLLTGWLVGFEVGGTGLGHNFLAGMYLKAL